MTGTAGARGPRAVPLTGADCFLRAFDAEIRRWNGASHVSQLVLRLGPGFDVERLRKLLGDVARAQPMLGAEVVRRFGIGAPVYRLAPPARRRAPAVAVHEMDGAPTEAVVHPALARRLNERRSLRRGELLCFDAVRHAGGALGTDLAMSWLQQLFDGAGSERFVTWLDECFRGVETPDRLPLPDELTREARSDRPARVRGEAALRWQRWHDGFGDHPVRSFAGPRRRERQALAYDHWAYSEPESERIAARAARSAGFLTPMPFSLAAALRAHDAVARARGFDPGSYLVPLPVNLRPKGAEGAVFRTHVSLIWFQVTPAEVRDREALIEALKRQRLAAIKAGHVQGGSDAMEFARIAPARLYARLARSAQRGELCSFFFAYTGTFAPQLESFLGAPVRGGFHVPAVPPSPGSCLAFSACRGRLDVTHVHQGAVFSDAERSILRGALADDLLGAD